ncbi:hypothetical protein [Mammaliicoccus lentus]|uniref:hypothetical protein n=1 Tax=Mammaliicoccus lentus TaxID=42858 RepID=UPI0026471040|nr:hypothetical protein [Mammaliicoccus lentus]
MDAYKKELIDFKVLDLCSIDRKNQQESLIKYISFCTDELIKKIDCARCDKFLISTVIHFTDVKIEEFQYNEAIYFNKLFYKKAPVVYGKIYSKEFKIFLVVIRPYLGDKDQKFFKNHPKIKEGKITNLSFKKIDDILKYDEIKKLTNYHEVLKGKI